MAVVLDRIGARKAELVAAAKAAPPPRGGRKVILVVSASQIRLRLSEDEGTLIEGERSGGGGSE